MNEGQARTQGGGSSSNGFPQRGMSGSVVLPTMKETVELNELSNNWDETQKFIAELTKDKDTLAQTNQECEDTVRQEFEALRALLDARENQLMDELAQKFQERDDKLANQIEELDNHKAANETAEDASKELIATITGRDERGEREKQVKALCQACIGKSPDIQKVPIDLKFLFKTQRETNNKIQTYGTLQAKRVQTGLQLKFTSLGITIHAKKRFLGTAIKDKDVPMLALGLVRAKYDKNTNGLSLLASVKEANLAEAASALDMKEPDQQNDLKEAYNRMKKEKTYLQTQCVGSKDKAWNGWQGDSFTFQSCVLLSKLVATGPGKYSMTIPTQGFEQGMFVHARARLVMVEDDSMIDDGVVDDCNVDRVSPWSKPNKASFGKAVGAPMSPASPKQEMSHYQAQPMHDEKEDDIGSDEDPGPAADITVPERLKVKCAITIDGSAQNKTLIMKAPKNPVHYDTLLAMVRQKTKNGGNFMFAVGGNAVSNNDDFMTYCVAPGEDPVLMTATLPPSQDA